MLKIFILALVLFLGNYSSAAGLSEYDAARRVVNFLVHNQPEKVKSICLGLACSKLSDANFFSKTRKLILKNSKTDLVDLRYQGHDTLLTLVGNQSGEILDFKIKESRRGPVGDRYSVYYVSDLELIQK